MKVLASLCSALLALTSPCVAGSFTAEITVYPIENFQIGKSQTDFGRLSYVGGFAMTSENQNFGALSSIRILDEAGLKFAAVADTGFFISGTILRDGANRPIGMGLMNFQELPDAQGRLSNSKWEVDSESLTVDGSTVTIGFERIHRLSVYPFDGTSLGERDKNLDFVVPQSELRSNRGFETLARSPESSPLQGALVAVSEKSIDKQGNILAAIIGGPLKGVFKISRSDQFDITDGDFLPNGNLLILERAFSMATGIRMRIREISAGDIKPGKIVEGTILLEANMANQIDNMEGLDVWQATDGSTRISLVSDDNKSILQRNLYLEFVLID